LEQVLLGGWARDNAATFAEFDRPFLLLAASFLN
jgi:hypothetical protein